MPKIKCRYCEKDITYTSISDIPTFPFCSERCQLIDLGLWLTEERSIEESLENDTIEGKQKTNHQ